MEKQIQDMNLGDLERKERMTVPISTRTTKARAKWMNEKNISPTKVFNKTLEILMAQDLASKKKNKK